MFVGKIRSVFDISTSCWEEGLLADPSGSDASDGVFAGAGA